MARIDSLRGAFTLFSLRGALAHFVGPARGRLVASYVGRIVAVLLGIYGVLSGTLLLTVIALFVFLKSSAESRSEMWDARLQGIPVSQLMDPFVTTVRDDAPIEEAALHFQRARRVRMLVEREGRVVGMVSASRVHAVPFTYRVKMPVGALMDAAPAPLTSHDSVTAALRRMDDLEIDELPVVDAGQLSGILRLSEVHRWIEHVAAEERGAATAREVPTT